MAKRITVVVSQGQSHNPAKRALEEDIVAALLGEPGVDVMVVPHLYDLKPDGTGILALQGVGGNMIVLSWLFDRAAHWTLDRAGIHGRAGETLLHSEEEEDDDEDDSDDTEAADDKPRVVDQRDIPNRKIYCLDLRANNSAKVYVDEIKRIAGENNTQVVQLGDSLLPSPSGRGQEEGAAEKAAASPGALTDWLSGNAPTDQLQRYLRPTNDTALGGNGKLAAKAASNGNGKAAGKNAAEADSTDNKSHEPLRIEEQPDRRWYPVIDYSRCTNCMECIDFCLFGVYGVDRVETILVEQPDNCRKGCPACSRVCPENAIIFPQHKSPAIAGSAVANAGLKIDLSKLFGAPDSDPLELAARERDEQLALAGRQTVGMTIGMPKRQENKEQQPKDELDDLIDELDEMDL